MSTDRSRSILLQVAFKAAVDVSEDIDVVRTTTSNYFTLLESLHSDFGISLEQQRSSGGGGFQKRESKPLPEGASLFNYEGNQWIDYRGPKDSGIAKSGHPDFKTLDNQTSIWMIDRDGNPSTEAEGLVLAADGAATLA